MCATRFTDGALRVSAYYILAYFASLVAGTAQMFRKSVDTDVLLRQTPVTEIRIHFAIRVPCD